MHSFVTIDPTPPRACFTGARVGGSEGSFQLHTGGQWCRSIPPSRLQPASLAPPPPRPRAGTTRFTRAETSPPRSRAALAPKPPPTYAPELALPPASPSAPEPRRPPLRSGTETAPERSRSGATPRRDAPERDWPCSGAKSGFAPEPSRRDAGAGPTRRRSAASPVAPERGFADTPKNQNRWTIDYTG